MNKELEPNVVAYNCRISKLCQNSDNFKAKELLNVKVLKGIQPNLTTFNTILMGSVEKEIC